MQAQDEEEPDGNASKSVEATAVMGSRFWFLPTLVAAELHVPRRLINLLKDGAVDDSGSLPSPRSYHIITRFAREETSICSLNRKRLADLDSLMHKRGRTVESQSLRIWFQRLSLVQPGKAFWADGIFFPLNATSQIVSRLKGFWTFQGVNHSCSLLNVLLCERACSKPKRSDFPIGSKGQLTYLFVGQMHGVLLWEEKHSPLHSLICPVNELMPC
jgi:hypothetical protein